MADFKIGDRVIYMETTFAGVVIRRLKGVVTSYSQSPAQRFIFVRYDYQHPEAPGQATFKKYITLDKDYPK